MTSSKSSRLNAWKIFLKRPEAFKNISDGDYSISETYYLNHLTKSTEKVKRSKLKIQFEGE